MRENDLFSNEFPQRPEHDIAPEHSMLPEYNPVYPDITFFKESSVTCREENIFQGRPPEGEPDRRSRREERKKRNRYSILQKFLGSALRGGAAVLCAAMVVAVITSDGDDSRGIFASKIAASVNSAKRPAFTQQTGYGADQFARLWDGDPNAPHKYNIEDPQAYVEPTCTDEGDADYVCTVCGIHVHYAIPANGHTAGDPVIQNEKAPTCTEEGSYEEVVNCSVCGEELSRRTYAISKAEHSPGEAIRENIRAASCTSEGSYDEVVLCTVCGEDVSRTTVIIPPIGHLAGAEVREQEVPGSCTDPGYFNLVTYCENCGVMLSRRTVTNAALGHTEGEHAIENEVQPTCTAEGSYDDVVFCSVCGEEMSRTTVMIDALEHTEGEHSIENEVQPTCGEEGSYDEVEFCSVCGEEMSRITRSIPKTGDHQPGDPITEVITEVSCEINGEISEITYCTVCGEELDRRTITEEAYGHDYENGTVEYEWAYDYNSVRAVIHCAHDSSHTTDVIVETDAEVLVEGNCQEKRTVRYVAVFDSNYPNVTDQEQTVESEYGDHVAGDTLEDRDSYEAPTCEGVGHYDTVTYCAVCGEEIDRQVTDIPATGHDWAEPTYEWEGNNASVTARVVCNNDSSHGRTEVAETTIEYTERPTCTTDGAGIYTAVFEDELFTPQSKRAAIEATGHTTEKRRVYVEGNFDLTGPDCIYGGVYYEETYCTVCGEVLETGEDVVEEGSGAHSYDLSDLSDGAVLKCPDCGGYAITSKYDNYTNPTVYYDFSEDFLNAMAEKGYGISDVMLWSYSENEYVNSGGYEGDLYGDTNIPEEYAVSGARFRMDIFFENDDGTEEIYLSSNDVEVP